MRKDSNLLLTKQFQFMTTNIQIFTSEVFGEIRTCQVNNQIMFVGKDVAKALGYSNTQKAIRDHVDKEDKLTERIVLSGQNRSIIFINESGLYALILASKLDRAKAFKRWVTSEVLPAIRRTGRYEMLPAEVKLLGEQAEYCQQVLMSVDCLTTTQVAKELGMTGSELYRWIVALGIAYWQSGQYMLYAGYARMGLAKSRTHLRYNCMGRVRTEIYLVWTEEGRRFLHDVFSGMNNH